MHGRLFIVFGTLSLLQTVSTCPTNCSCTTHLNGTDVDCYRRGLTRIPNNIPTNTYFLELGQNVITKIGETALKNLSALQYIKLQNNRLLVIGSGIFQNLQLLQEISLDHNNIIRIKKMTFVNLSSLHNIYLYNNEIRVIEAGAFVNLPALRQIYLQKNFIAQAMAETFHNFPMLFSLELSDNRIAYIGKGAFDDLPSLKYFISERSEIQWRDIAHLDENNISKIDDGAFVDLPSLQRLYMYLYCNNCVNAPFLKWIRNKTQLYTYPRCRDFGNSSVVNLQESVIDKCYELESTVRTSPEYFNRVETTDGNRITTTSFGRFDSSAQTIRYMMYAISVIGVISLISFFATCGLCIMNKNQCFTQTKHHITKVPLSVNLIKLNDSGGPHTEPISEYEINERDFSHDFVETDNQPTPYEVICDNIRQDMHDYDISTCTNNSPLYSNINHKHFK